MSITNYPKVLKYAINDRLYTFNQYKDDFGYGYPGNTWVNDRYNGICKRVKVTGWRTIVTSLNESAVQTNYYMVKDIIGYSSENVLNAVELYSENEYELPADKLFTSKNHLISTIKGKYINSAFGNLHDNGYLYFSKMGNLGGGNLTNGDWIDWAGMNFEDMDFTEIIYNSAWAGGFVGGESPGTKTLILDSCNLTGAILPTGINTRGRFIDGIFSYDAETTIFTDGYPVGLPVSGKVSGVSGGSTLTGTSSRFLTELAVGGKIIIYNVAGTFTIASISSDTSLSIVGTFPGTFSNRFYSREHGI